MTDNAFRLFLLLSSPSYRKVGKQELYKTFCSAQSRAMQDVCQKVLAQGNKGETALTQLAMELSIEAAEPRMAAERILAEISLQKSKAEDETEEERHKKGKKGRRKPSFLKLKYTAFLYGNILCKEGYRCSDTP